MQTRSKGQQNLLQGIDCSTRSARKQRTTINNITVEEHLNMDDHNLPIPPAAAQRYIGAGDAPNTHTQRQGIVPPAIQNNNFEIKSSLISMIQGNRFHGLPMEDPLDHLDEFDRLCSLTKIAGVSEDSFKLRLFPFSLGDKAHTWEKSLPYGSITTWADCKTAFLSKFFSTSRTAKLRNEISGFTQKSNEPFSEAWERFKRSTSQCPHHGFSKESLLSTLYRGALPKIRMLLDTASNGNFMNKEVEAGWELVENLAQSDSTYNEDYDRNIRIGSNTEERQSREIKALNDKLDKLILSQQKHVHFASEEEFIQVQEGENDQLEEMNYVQNQGFQNQGGYQNRGFVNYKANPNLSYRSTNVANPRDQVYPPQQPQNQGFVSQPQNQGFVTQNQNQGFTARPQFQNAYQNPQQFNTPPGFSQQQQLPLVQDPTLQNFLQQIQKLQAAGVSDTNKQLAEIRNQLDNNNNILHNKLETLNTRIQYLEHSTASTSQPGQLPGKAVQNPKDYKHVNAITLCTGTSLTEDSEVQVGGEFSNNEIADVKLEGTTPSDTPSELPKMIELDAPTRGADRVIPEERQERYIPTAYVPKLPFPGRFKKQQIEEYQARFMKQLKEIKMISTISETMKLVPPSAQALRDAMMERIKEIESAEAVTKECSVMTLEKVVPEKLEDPGSFTLPCSLGDFSFKNCLCDLGASVNLMPLSVARKLGYTEYQQSTTYLMLADKSIRHPTGQLEDIPVKIGMVKVPTDFIVLEMDKEPSDQIILGRPFLATTGAVIDVKKGRIDLNFGENLVMKFDITNTVNKPLSLRKPTEEVPEPDRGSAGSTSKDKSDGYTPLGQTTWAGKPKPVFMPHNSFGSIETPSMDLEPDESNTDEWIELKRRFGLQVQAIKSLVNTVYELQNQVHALRNRVSTPKTLSGNKASEGGEETFGWNAYTDHPPDQAKPHFDMGITGDIDVDRTRERVLFNRNPGVSRKRTSVPLTQPP